MPIAIQIRHLGKTYISATSGQRVRALDDVSLDIEEGEILGVLGPNGAGKTTFLNILSTLVLPDQGSVEIFGVASKPENSQRLRSILNMSSGYPNFPWSLTIEENLQFYGRLYGLRGSPLQMKVRRLIEAFHLGDFSRRRFDELSSGLKQRLSLAKSLINDPKVLFLDEPTIGLDPDAAVTTRRIILDALRQSRITVLFTTHNMPEAEQMCQRVAFINKGRLLQIATPHEFKSVRGRKDLEEVFIDLARGPVAEGLSAVVTEHMIPAAGASVRLSQDWSHSLSVREKTLGWVNRTAAFTVRNTLFALRNVFAFVELVFWPVVSLISVGLMGNYLELKEQALAFILTGAVTAGVLQVTQLDVAYSLLYEVWSKSVKQTFLTPVGVTESLFGAWITGIARGLTIFVVLGIAAVGMFHVPLPPLGGMAVFLTGIFGSALLLGLLVTILILVFGQKAEITAWMFAYVFMLLCGIYYPVQTLPPFFYHLAQAVPITYFLEYFRQGFGFPPNFEHLLLKGFGLTLFYLILGILFMRRAADHARRRGTIVRLSE